MGQISVKTYAANGSLLNDNQHQTRQKLENMITWFAQKYTEIQAVQSFSRATIGPTKRQFCLAKLRTVSFIFSPRIGTQAVVLVKYARLAGPTSYRLSSNI